MVYVHMYLSAYYIMSPQVIERTCVEVTVIEPGKLCKYRNSTNLVLKGRGFTLNLRRERAACRFRTDTRVIGTDMKIKNFTYYVHIHRDEMGLHSVT